ncbi:hypothetical protein GCM10010238_48910 [Streptomyces griseoviridis]|uniref:Uncharacterized protein n=1 Tax=Streptomyces griseoviridis TaxID=45398 RepID=A0A918LIU2_STRGD|nr:hypothetical protein GCM10010238_48910 [Streptomyces niveoruber]
MHHKRAHNGVRGGGTVLRGVGRERMADGVGRERTTAGAGRERATADVGQERVAAGEEDVRVRELRTAVARLRRLLAALPAEFPDRGIAEEELAGLAAMAADGVPEVPRLRRSLLLLAGAIGSVSALSAGLTEVRHAVELFGEPPRR